MLRVFAGFALLSLLVFAALGVRGRWFTDRPIVVLADMDFQPRYEAQGPGPFFADGRASREPITGTVAFGGRNYAADAGRPQQDPDLLAADDVLYRGVGPDGKPVLHGPTPISLELLKRGRGQFEIYCAVCHGAAGLGNGPAKQAGFAEVAKLTDARIRSMPDGQIFQTISNGKGLMAPYAAQISPHDRWAVVAYVRALQRSQNARLTDVPEPHRTELQSRD